MRIGQSPSATPAGLAIGGEVEDYPVEVIPIEPLLADDDTYVIDEDHTLDTLADNELSIADGDSIDPLSFVSTDFNVIQQPQHGTVTVDPASGHFVYDPDEDFNGDDSFTYRIGSLITTPVATVTITVNPINDPPAFEIDAPLVAGIPTLNLLESDDPSVTLGPQFVFNEGPGPMTATDETATQQVSLTILDSVVPAGLMTAPPQLTPDGQLTVFPRRRCHWHGNLHHTRCRFAAG